MESDLATIDRPQTDQFDTLFNDVRVIRENFNFICNSRNFKPLVLTQTAIPLFIRNQN